ncbi:hypothetical protein FRC12_024654 [Ceratobasidium sp. 428]|nr:hypothetical protein FRC12_024654 [Ceratobasidium sp. 428]
MTAEDIKFLSQEAELLTDYVREAKDFDEEMVDGWNRSLDVTLVFASLFSAIVTAFVLESAKQLEPDKADQTVEILREIARTLQAGAVRPQVTGNYEASADTEFHPTRSAVWVNCFWFLSLSTSMSVSLVAILAKQWCYYYLSGRSGDAVNQAEERLKRYRGLDKWMMREILEHLPLLMHIALSTFAFGAVIYMWSINVAVASSFLAIFVIASCFYQGTMLVAILDSSCPFKTTQSVYMRIFVDRVAQWFHTTQPAMLRKTESIRNEPRHTAIDVQSTDSLSHAADPPSPVGSNQEAIRPFVKEALEWLIFNSQNSASIDTAIGALVVGRVQFDNGDLERQAMFHMARHFSDCFSPGQQDFKLQLGHRQNALKQALDYVSWMTYFAENKPAGVPGQVQQFVSTLGTELVTRLGLAFASLADQRTLSVDVGKNVAFWLSSFIKCYDEETIYLIEDTLSIIIDGLTIAGRNVGEIQDRAHVLAIPQLINILWKVSHINQSVVRSSIGLNLAVFSLTTKIPYPIDTNDFKSAADYLAYDYRSHNDRNTSFTSFAVFALLGFVHPESKLGLGIRELETVTKIIHETRYLDQAQLSIELPKLTEYNPLRRCLTSMLVEGMIKTPNSPQMERDNLIMTAYKPGEVRDDWIINKTFQSTMHAICTLIIAHLNEQAVLYDDAIVAVTDILHREVQKLKRLDAAVIGSEPFNRTHGDISSSHGIASTEEMITGPETPERMASVALALIMKKSNNKQCLETAVRAILHHTNRCDVELVIQATRWFANTFKAAEYSGEGNKTEDQHLRMCGYIRILISMALHCPDPIGLAQSLCVQNGGCSSMDDYNFVEEKLQLLYTKARDTHVHAFAIAGLAVWEFGCSDSTYTIEQTRNKLHDVWSLIMKHTDRNTRPEPPEQATGHPTDTDILPPEAIEALVDATVMFTAVTDSMPMISSSQTHALLGLLGQFRLDNQEPARLALSVALTFWGLSLDPGSWKFWTPEERMRWWRFYLQPAERTKDVAALFLLGLSRILAHYEQLMLNHASIKTISHEIDRYMHQHANHPDTLTLPFLTGFDVRRHVRETVRDYLQKTESNGPFTNSTTMSRNKLRSALQYDGGEGFRYEIPDPFSPTGDQQTEIIIGRLGTE